MMLFLLDEYKSQKSSSKPQASSPKPYVPKLNIQVPNYRKCLLLVVFFSLNLKFGAWNLEFTLFVNI